MTLASWKAEFLPVPASVPTNAIEAIDHSILKWKGRLPENLAKHKMRVDASIISELGGPDCASDALFGSEDCALCNLYFNESDGHESPPDANCTACPLAQSLGRSCVGSRYEDGERVSGVYHRGLNDATVMVKALEACREDATDKIIDEQELARRAEVDAEIRASL